MALSNNNNDNSKLLILKVKTKDAEGKEIDPTFQVSQKGENGKWSPTGTVSNVAGDLTRADVKEGEYEGQKTYNISLYLKDLDAAETYLVDLKLNMLTRGLLNNLLGLTKYEDVKLGLYKNAKGYPAVAVRQKGELSKWKYSLDELPKVESITFKGKKMNDYTAVDDFFISKVKELGEKLSGSQTKVVKTDKPTESAPADHDTQEKEEDLF